MSVVRVAERLHGWLTTVLPRRVRESHGAAIAAAFADAARDARTRGGVRAVAWLLMREALDVARAGLEARMGGGGVMPERDRNEGRGGYGAVVVEDVVQGVRAWQRRPGFAAIALVVLGLGIGSTTAMWTIADGVLFRPLPYEDPERLVVISQTLESMGGAKVTVAYPNYADFRSDATTGFEDMAAYAGAPAMATVVLESGPEALRMARVSGNLFDLLGREAAVGRALAETDDSPSSPRVVVISHSLWQTRFGGEAVRGRVLRIDDQAYEVVGVMPARFSFPWQELDLWVPLRIDPVQADRDTRWLRVLGRLRAGVTFDEATRRMEASMARLIAAYPADNRGNGIALDRYHERLVSDARVAMLVLVGAASVLLLLACANLANLMLSRGATRRREMAVRSALGAGRARLVFQLFAENAVLAVAGGMFGVLLARWAVSLLVALAPAALPRRADIVLDMRVLLFALAATMASGVLFGLVPAFRVARGDAAEALREGARGTGAGGRHRGLHVLVVAQLALALVLLSGGGLLLHSFARLVSVDPGFDARGVYTLHVAPPPSRYPDDVSVQAFFARLVEEAGELPGVRSAAATWALPFTGMWASGRITVEGSPRPPGRELTVGTIPVRGDYFATVGIPLRAGRALAVTDDASSALVVIVNRTTANALWPGQDAVGKRFKRGAADEDLPWITVIGVVDDAQQFGLADEVPLAMYWNHPQRTWARDMYLVVRAAGDAASLAAPLRALVRRLDPDLAITDAGLLEDRIHASIATPRFRTLLVATFAVLALLLSLIGTYGVMALLVAERQHEIGVRMALGARRGRVLRGVLADGARLILAGLVVGMPAALLASRALVTLLFGVEPRDPVTHAVAAAVLIIAALLACLVPALRASRLDPILALRD